MDPNEQNPITPAPVTPPEPVVVPVIPNTEPIPTAPLPAEQSVFQEIPPKPKSKILLLLIIILLLAGLAFVAYKYYQNNLVSTKEEVIQEEVIPTVVVTKDPTADWQVLSNENGFSIKYPLTHKVLGEGMDVTEINATDIIVAVSPGDPSDVSPAIHINVADKAYTVYKDMNLIEISKLNYDANQLNENTFKKVINPLVATTLDGKPAFTYTIEANAYSGKWSGWPVNASLDNAQDITVLESENNGKYFIIAYNSGDEIIDTVYTSFKFTN